MASFYVGSVAGGQELGVMAPPPPRSRSTATREMPHKSGITSIHLSSISQTTNLRLSSKEGSSCSVEVDSGALGLCEKIDEVTPTGMPG